MKKWFAVVLAGVLLMCGAVPNVFAADKGNVELAYVEWSCATATANVTKVVLEKLGYEVDITPVSAAAMVPAA